MREVRFLGGPWHDRREQIEEPLPHTLCVAEALSVVASFDEPADVMADEPEIRHYQLRWLVRRSIDSPPGKPLPRWPVYVAYGYDGPLRP